MTVVAATDRPDEPLSLDELFDRANRLWRYADEIYSATKYPFVSREALRKAPTFGHIFRHLYDAGRASVQAEYGPEIQRLEDEIARLEAEIRANGGEPPPRTVSEQQQMASAATFSSQPPSRPAADVDPDAFPWLREWVESIEARVAIDSLCFAVLDHPVKEPPSDWPEVIRRPVKRFTGLHLVSTTEKVIFGRLGPPRDECAEAFLARFTRRILRLDGNLWGAVACTIIDGRWRNADNPLAYISRAARREHLRAEGWLDPSRSGDVFARGTPRSLDIPVTATGDPLASLIPAQLDPFAETEFWVDLERAVELSGLSPSARLALYARREGISRREAPEVLNLPAADVEAGWKALQRHLDRLRANLSA